jgi:hypothetical protein
MNGDIEQLVREGLDRLAAAAEVPAGLAGRARRRRRRRRLAAGSAIASGIATASAVAVIAATSAVAGPGGHAGTHGVTRAQTDAYLVLRHMESAIAQQHLVMRGDTTSTFRPGANSRDRSVTWSYRKQSSFVEFTAGGQRYLAAGTAEIGGKLRDAYVTYFDRKWSGGGAPYTPPSNACGKNAVMMGGPVPTSNWPALIKATLACGSATVTGHVWIHGVRTLEITGSPLTVRLPKGMVKATRARMTYRLYVNPSTYLPVRTSGTTFSYGPGTASYSFTSVTDIRWLRPTDANIARTLVTIPPGFRHVKSAADQ